MKPNRNFETSRLILKPTTIDDATFIFELLNSPKWLKYIGDCDIKSLSDAVGYIEERIRPQQIEFGYSNYTVIRKSDGVKIGSCGLYKREELENIDIGFAFLPEYEKQGYGFESAKRMRDAAFKTFHLNKLCAITNRDNLASRRLLEKIGLKYMRDVVLSHKAQKLMYYEKDNKSTFTKSG